MARTLPRVAHGIFTWQDGRVALEAALRSTAGIVDELIIADGLIQGVDPGLLPWLSDLSWLADADYLPASVPVNGKEWRSLSDACTWILSIARERECDWLLFIDADQELHNGGRLKEWLTTWPGDAFPLSRADPVGRHPVPWQCIRVAAFERYLYGCYGIVRRLNPGIEVVSLVPEQPDELLPAGAPWISHHPERRLPGRQEHRLGALETVLEPPPADLPTLPLALLLPSRWRRANNARVSEPQDETTTAAPTSGNEQGEPEWFCDQCGARYYGPGVCQNNHAPAELRKIADVEAAESLPAPEPPAAAAEPVDAPDAPVAEEAPAAEPPPVPATTEPTGEDPTLVRDAFEQAKSLLDKARDLLHSIG